MALECLDRKLAELYSTEPTSEVHRVWLDDRYEFLRAERVEAEEALAATTPHRSHDGEPF